MASKFGGIPVDQPVTASKFGGVAIDQAPVAAEQEAPQGRQPFDIATLFGGEPSTDAERAKVLAETERSAAFGRGALQTLGQLATDLPRAAISGLAGLAAGGLGGTEAGARAVEATTEAFSIPQGPEAQALAQGIAGSAPVQLLGEAIGFAEEQTAGRLAEAGFPGAATVVASAPVALAELFGLKGVRRTRTAPTPEAIEAEAGRAEILQAGREARVPVATSDLFAPNTSAGKLLQSFSEKVPFVGTGEMRARQQVARQDAVREIAEDFNIDDTSEFAPEIVRSLRSQDKKNMQAAAIKRNQAISKLNEFGAVPMNRLSSEIDSQISRLQGIQRGGNKEAIIKQLQETKAALTGDVSFELGKDIRTDIIADLKAAGRSEDTRNVQVWSPIKQAIDKDLNKFANASDPASAKKWRQANRQFAEGLDVSKRSVLKKLINDDNVPPENVMNIIRSNKPSQLKLLDKSLTDTGRAKVRATIIQDSLRKSINEDGTFNPNKFLTSINKPNNKAAVDQFFKGAEGEQLKGLTKLLSVTRRAQDAAAAPQTGVQLIPALTLGTAGAAPFSPAALSALTVGVGAAGARRIFESRRVRDMLVRLNRAKPGSKVEIDLLNQIPLAITIAAQGRGEGQESS